MKTEIKLEPGKSGTAGTSDDEKRKQMLTDAVHHAVNLLKEEGIITSTISKELSSSSEEIGRELCRRIKEATGIHDPEIKLIKVKREPVAEIDLEVDCMVVEESAKSSNREDAAAGSLFSTSDNYSSEGTARGYINPYIPWDMKVKAVTLAMLHPKWSLKTIRVKTTQHLRTPYQLMMWKQAVRKTTVVENYRIISDLTYKRFLNAYSKDEPIKFRTLQTWAMQAAQQFLSGSKFKASDTWVYKFLKDHNIHECKATGLLKM